MRRFIVSLSVAFLLFTVGSLYLPSYHMEKPTAYGVFSENGSSVSIFTPTARMVSISVVPDNEQKYSVLVFDGGRERFIANFTAVGGMYREFELPDSGTYYFVYLGDGTARIAIGTLETYYSREVLTAQYIVSGTLAFLLAALVAKRVKL